MSPRDPGPPLLAYSWTAADDPRRLLAQADLLVARLRKVSPSDRLLGDISALIREACARLDAAEQRRPSIVETIDRLLP